ncbi:MAG TPA: discoidin domain-containing protein [Opitutaceae bacterium]
MFFPRSCVLASVLFSTVALPTRAQLLEYTGSGAIVGTTGPAPDFLSPDGAVVDYTFVFDSSAAPTSATPYSATYAGIDGVVGFGAGDVRTLTGVTLTITKDPATATYDYIFAGFTTEGWKVIHSASSTSADFVPNLSLPSVSPSWPPEEEFAAGYVDIKGSDNAWTAYSDAEPWFAVNVLTLANRAGGGTASASKQKLPGEGAAQAFDGSSATKWFASNVSTAWVQYRFADSDARIVVRYDITSASDVANRDPRDWQFQGSHDGVTWTTLDTRTGELFATRRQTKQYGIANTTAFEFYRLTISATRGAGSGIQLSELALMAY